MDRSRFSMMALFSTFTETTNVVGIVVGFTVTDFVVIAGASAVLLAMTSVLLHL